MNLFSSLLKENFIINIFIEIVFQFIVILFFQKICKIHLTKKMNCIYVLANTICFTLIAFFANYILANILTICLAILLFIYILKISKIHTLTYFSIKSIFMLNIYFLVFNIISKITNYTSYADIIKLPICKLLSIALISIIGLIIYISVKNLKISTLLETSINKNSNPIIAISTVNLFISFSILYLFFEILAENIFYILALDLYFWLSIYSIINLCRTSYNTAKINNLKLCNKNVLTMCDETRAFKHDFHNIIQAIGGYICTNDMPGLKQYYSQIFSDCKLIINSSKLNPELINNPAIYNILADKYHLANTNNIKINLECMLDLNNLNIKIYEFTRILGILLDNAIEATQECETKHINIFFKKDKYKQMLVIENTYVNKQVCIDEIFQKNFTTKPHNTGLGLWEVKRILKRNSNLNLHTSKTNDYFSQQLEIYSC